MPQARAAWRTVWVNVNRGGMVHRDDCRWLHGVLNAGGLNASSYKQMPAQNRACSPGSSGAL
jgi:hypothetical protein